MGAGRGISREKERMELLSDFSIFGRNEPTYCGWVSARTFQIRQSLIPSAELQKGAGALRREGEGELTVTINNAERSSDPPDRYCFGPSEPPNALNGDGQTEIAARSFGSSAAVRLRSFRWPRLGSSFYFIISCSSTDIASAGASGL